MALKEWKKLAGAAVFKNRWWTYMRDVYELPSGAQGEYHFVHTNGSSMVVPVLDDGRILCVNQYRYLRSRESIEFPCGSVKDGSTHDRTAWEELAEETGYSAKQLALVGTFNPYNGVTDEMCQVYIARELTFVGANPDETEELENVPLTPAELARKIADGSIWDGMTVVAWHLVKSKGLL